MIIAGVLNDSFYGLSRTKKEFFFQTFDTKTKTLTSSKPFIILRFHEIKDYVIASNKLFLTQSFYGKTDRNCGFIVKEIENNEIVNTAVILSVASEPNARRARPTYLVYFR